MENDVGEVWTKKVRWRRPPSQTKSDDAIRIRTQPSASLSEVKKLAEQLRWCAALAFSHARSSAAASPLPVLLAVEFQVPFKCPFAGDLYCACAKTQIPATKVRIATNSNPIASSQAASGARSDQPCPPAKTTSPGGNGCSQVQFYRANQPRFSNTIAASCFSLLKLALYTTDLVMSMLQSPGFPDSVE